MRSVTSSSFSGTCASRAIARLRMLLRAARADGLNGETSTSGIVAARIGLDDLRVLDRLFVADFFCLAHPESHDLGVVLIRGGIGDSGFSERAIEDDFR